MRIKDQKIREETKKHSVFLSCVKQTNIIYGDKWATMTKGRVDEATNFNEIGHTFEKPEAYV